MSANVLKPRVFTAKSAATLFWLIMVPFTRVISTWVWPYVISGRTAPQTIAGIPALWYVSTVAIAVTEQ
jgi:hypothetical protein